MSSRDDNFLVTDILEAIQKILAYKEGLSYEEFLKDSKTKDAIVMNLLIIGEASNRLSEDFKTENSRVPWSKLRGFRNRLIHEYFGVDYSIVWNVISNELISVENEIKNLI